MSAFAGAREGEVVAEEGLIEDRERDGEKEVWGAPHSAHEALRG